MKKNLFLSATIIFSALVMMGQESDQEWHHYDYTPKKIAGTGVQKAYQELLKNMKSEKVVVAVIDSGTDIEHEDLKDKIWVNKDEIPGNGIDDDQNGYIDDVHGWNFLGGKDGRMLNDETIEVTRIYKKYTDRFEGKERADLTNEEKIDYDKYLEYKDLFEKALAAAKEDSAKTMQIVNRYKEYHSLLIAATGKED